MLINIVCYLICALFSNELREVHLEFKRRIPQGKILLGIDVVAKSFWDKKYWLMRNYFAELKYLEEIAIHSRFTSDW